MSDTYTSSLGLQVPTVGGDSGTWGTVLNTDLALIDSSIAGKTLVTLAGQSALTFTFVAGGGDQFKQPLWVIAGAAAAGGTTISLPAIAFQRWYNHNASTGNVTMTLNTAGAALTFTPAQSGLWFLISSDGTNLSIPFLGNGITSAGAINATGNIITPATVQGGGILATGYVAGANLNITNNGTFGAYCGANNLAIQNAGTFGGAVTAGGAVVSSTYIQSAQQFSAPALVAMTTGSTVAAANNVVTVYTAGGTIAAYTIDFTASPASAVYMLNFQQTITSLTILGTGKTLINAPTTVAAGKTLHVYIAGTVVYFGT